MCRASQDNLLSYTLFEVMMSSVDNKNCNKKLNKSVCGIKKVNNFRSFPQYHHLLTMSGMRLIINSNYGLFLTLFKMGLLGAAHG